MNTKINTKISTKIPALVQQGSNTLPPNLDGDNIAFEKVDTDGDGIVFDEGFEY